MAKSSAELQERISPGESILKLKSTMKLGGGGGMQMELARANWVGFRQDELSLPRQFCAGGSVRRRMLWAAALLVLASVLATGSAVSGQSAKGARQQPVTTNSYEAAPSPGTQVRQQQQQQQQQQVSYAKTSSQPTTLSSKRRQPQQARVEQQTIEQQQQQQRPADQQQSRSLSDYQTPTEDPLADSEPALYGSVAGAPGVDFPAYTRIPKTSFTCEGKGFDFGFYADEEAQCQLYHVCWEGRRESFLCGVGTVFNQAILACDYWHSVDCSKSSQFYSVNSELGKAGAEPAAGSSRGRAASDSFGEPINQRRQQPIVQQQQQQSYASDDSNFDQPQQQVAATSTGKGSPQRQAPVQSYSQSAQRQITTGSSYDQQQRVEPQQAATKTQIQQRPIQPASLPAPTTTQTPAVKRPRFNMDLSQKVNSLIESPVRPPIKSRAGPQVLRQRQPLPAATTRRPPTANFAQLAVARAQATGSRTPSGQRKGSPVQIQQQQPQQQQQYDSDLDDNVQQQQQLQNFDDSPVQTSTANYGRQQQPTGGPQRQAPQGFAGVQQQQQIIQSGTGPEASSAITTQYDTLQPAGLGADSPYESALDDSANSSDDFRSAGAKAAASQNQNWYIMRAI